MVFDQIYSLNIWVDNSQIGAKGDGAVSHLLVSYI
jgi:hypothetical protein